MPTSPRSAVVGRYKRKHKVVRTSRGTSIARKPKETTLIGDLAKLIHSTAYEDISPAAIEYTKLLSLSVTGATLAGTTEPAGKIITDYVRAQAAAPEAGVLGCGFRTTMDNAALANNTLWHSTELEGNCYPEVVSLFMLFPPLLGVAEKFHLSGRKLLEACVIAHEVQGRLGRAANPDPDAPDSFTYMNFDTMAILGIAAGVSKLLNLDNEKTAMALSLAASQAGGIAKQTGSMAHYLESGFAGRVGVAAALLARSGMTGRAEILEVSGGLLDIMTGGGGEYDFDSILGAWGSPFRILEQEEKLFPCCSLMQHLIEMARSLTQKHKIDPNDILSVEVETNLLHGGFCRFDNPLTSDEAKFSIPHGIAVAILDSKVDLRSFGARRLNDPDVRTLMQKIKVKLHPEWKAGNLAQPHPVAIKLRDGRRIKGETQGFRGHPPNFPTREEFIEKFRYYGGLVLSESQVIRCEARVLGLDVLDNVAALAAELTYPETAT